MSHLWIIKIREFSFVAAVCLSSLVNHNGGLLDGFLKHCLYSGRFKFCFKICFNAFAQNKWIIFGSAHLCCSKIEKKEGPIWNWNSTIPSCITLFFIFWPSCQTVLPATEWSDGLQSLKTHARAFKCADYSSLCLSFLSPPTPLICDIWTYTPVLYTTQ